jgi:PD-(D/E)XK nuclease superfamily
MPEPQFKWSFSRLTAFETCGLRYYKTDLAKEVADPPSPQMLYGLEVHEGLEVACRDGVPLPPKLVSYQDVVDKLAKLPGVREFERAIGIREDFSPCEFDDPLSWYRAKIDVLARAGSKAVVIDFKTGKLRPKMLQLQLNAAAVFMHHPDVMQVEMALWWLAVKDRPMTKGIIYRGDLPALWAAILPRVRAFQLAAKLDRWSPKPSGLCKNYCPVATCEFNGKYRK